MLSVQIEDEHVLIPVRQQVADMEQIYKLNPSGARIWELIDGVRQVKSLHAVLVQEFDVTSEQADSDLGALLSEFNERGMVQPQ